MIAADTSAWIGFSRGVNSQAAHTLERALEHDSVVLPLVVMVELLSGPAITKEVESLISALPRLELTSGYWERVVEIRRNLLKKGSRARLGDCLIAQSCIDEHIPLITADQDFRHFVKFGLILA